MMDSMVSTPCKVCAALSPGGVVRAAAAHAVSLDRGYGLLHEVATEADIRIDAALYRARVLFVAAARRWEQDRAQFEGVAAVRRGAMDRAMLDMLCERRPAPARNCRRVADPGPAPDFSDTLKSIETDMSLVFQLSSRAGALAALAAND